MNHVDYMQLPQALLQLEPRVKRAYGLSADGQADRLVLAVEGSEPRHASLTDLTLPVVKHSVYGGSAALLFIPFRNSGV